MKCTINNKEIEIVKMPGFFIVALADKTTHKVVTYSIEDYFEAVKKFTELKKLIKETK